MNRYTERLTTLVDKKTLKQIKAAAKRERMPLSEWVRWLIENELAG